MQYEIQLSVERANQVHGAGIDHAVVSIRCSDNEAVRNRSEIITDHSDRRTEVIKRFFSEAGPMYNTVE